MFKILLINCNNVSTACKKFIIKESLILIITSQVHDQIAYLYKKVLS